MLCTAIWTPYHLIYVYINTLRCELMNQWFSSPEICLYRWLNCAIICMPSIKHIYPLSSFITPWKQYTCSHMQTNMHTMSVSWLEWAIYRIDCDDVLNYSPTIHTLANLEQLLTDSMTPMLDVKLDHRHCSSPKCPTICRLGQYVPVAILSCIVASFMTIAHWLCAFAFVFVLQLIWANLPLPQFFFRFNVYTDACFVLW